jgi:hypothetical protein
MNTGAAVNTERKEGTGEEHGMKGRRHRER